MSYFLEFLSWIMQNTRKGWTRDQNIDSYGKILFLGKIYCFYQKRKWIFEKFWFLLHLVLWPYSISVPNFRTIWLIFYEIWQFKFISYWNNIFLYHFYTGLWESSSTLYRDRETHPSVKDLQSTTSRYFYPLLIVRYILECSTITYTHCCDVITSCLCLMNKLVKQDTWCQRWDKYFDR